jgi:GH25 family lysozyme M1 (1,4-beta-N-acetylmuramidase)
MMNFVNEGIQGADVSYWQDDNATPQQIDFSKAVLNGALYTIVRAGQGSWPDPDFKINWRNAKVADLPRGSYWYYDSRYDPEKQATLWASLLTDRPELEIFLDLEEHYGGPYSGYVYWKKFLNKLRTLLPTVRIGIYTGYYYITGRIPASEYAYFSQFILWLSWYTQNVSYVLIPAPWKSCLYWQWGTPVWGLAWGCESLEIDMNLFNGTREDFNKRYGFGGSMYSGKAKVDAKLWKSVGGAQIDTIKAGASVRGYAPQGDYVQLVSPAGWTKKIWLDPYDSEAIIVPPPPPPPSTRYIIYHAEDGTEEKFVPEK